MKFGEKWKLEQAEHIGAPISGLHWARESMYVRDEPCQASQLSIMGDLSASSGPPDTCAVLLTTATLKQKSSSKDATPEDFKLHELRTMGTAKGAAEIDRKSTRLNSSHLVISYAVFCLKKKK